MRSARTSLASITTQRCGRSRQMTMLPVQSLWPPLNHAGPRRIPERDHAEAGREADRGVAPVRLVREGSGTGAARRSAPAGAPVRRARRARGRRRARCRPTCAPGRRSSCPWSPRRWRGCARRAAPCVPSSRSRRRGSPRSPARHCMLVRVMPKRSKTRRCISRPTSRPRPSSSDQLQDVEALARVAVARARDRGGSAAARRPRASGSWRSPWCG